MAMPAHLPGSRPYILVVDDNPDNTSFLQILLENEGHHVEIAYSGQEALQRIAIALPQLILMDVMMPEMDGFTVVRKIRRNRRLQGIPIILITAYPEQCSEQGWRLGADDILYKPIDHNELISRIRLCLPLSNEANEVTELWK